MSQTITANYISFEEMKNLHLYTGNHSHRIETGREKDVPGNVRHKLLSLLGIASSSFDVSLSKLVTRSSYHSGHYWYPDQREVKGGKDIPIIVPKSTDDYYDSNVNTEILTIANPSTVHLKHFVLCQKINDGYHYWRDRLAHGGYRCIVTVAPSQAIASETVVSTPLIRGEEVTFLMPILVAEEIFGLTLVPDGDGLKAKLANGQEFSVRDSLCESLATSNYSQIPVFSQFRKAPNQNAILSAYLKTSKGSGKPQALKGIQKTWKKINGLLEGLSKADPRGYVAFCHLASMATKTIDRVRVSVVFNTALQDVTTVEEFVAAIKPLADAIGTNEYSWFEDGLKAMPQYVSKRKTILKSQTKRAHSKLMQDMEFIEIDEKIFPLTSAAVSSGQIPLSTFFSKKEQYFLFNNNWALWEKMLELYPDITISLAKEVSTRTTYEKDLMSYFYNVLYDLPEYLEKNTGHKWTGIPKLLNDSSALDSSSMAEGVTKERSAMTPIVDNDNHTVTVPFVSVYMPGRFGVYCYAHQYNVLRRGVMHEGSVVLKDIEEKLNGKDDYGLMFYTLIGTSKGNGYPAFLIIFERLHSGTRVHIHRVNPCRSKDGDKLAIHDWTKNCYNWMAGNVRCDRIKTSQGDLMFVLIEDEVNRTIDKTVNNFDSHTFDKDIAFCTDVPKSQKNLLGYCQLQSDTWLRHPEHEDRLLEMGAYEIRQARSYENNPAGNWSLTID